MPTQTVRQTSAEKISMLECAKMVIKKDGLAGLFGRGLSTRIVTNGLQGLMFNIMSVPDSLLFPFLPHSLSASALAYAAILSCWLTNTSYSAMETRLSAEGVKDVTVCVAT